MADFTALKTAIQTYIKQNGNEEITGNILQEVLLSVVTTLGDSAINDLITALGNEVTARQQADGTLQQNITNEATARGNADTALSNRLGSTITAENTAAAQIGAEAEARAAADTALQGLIDGVKNNVDNGYVYAGIATPATTPVTGKVFYLALTAGTYTNFGSTEVSQGINILKYNGSAWSLDAFIGIDDTPTPNSPKLVKSGGTFESIMTDGSAFDISAHFASGGTLATYADLSAALADLDTLSASYKKGGMSIKFVQSSDNKYVQYLLTKKVWSINVNNWEKNNELLDSNIVEGNIIKNKYVSYQNGAVTEIGNDDFFINKEKIQIPTKFRWYAGNNSEFSESPKPQLIAYSVDGSTYVDYYNFYAEGTDESGNVYQLVSVSQNYKIVASFRKGGVCKITDNSGNIIWEPIQDSNEKYISSYDVRDPATKRTVQSQIDDLLDNGIFSNETKLFIGNIVSGVPSANATIAPSSTYVCMQTLTDVPFMRATLKFHLPTGIIAGVRSGNCGVNSNTSQVNLTENIEDGDSFTFSDDDMLFRLFFKHSDGSNITAQEVNTYIGNGSLYVTFNESCPILTAQADCDKYAKALMFKFHPSGSDKNKNYLGNIPVFAHISDIHGDSTRLERFMQYCDSLPIVAALNTGDSCSQNFNNGLKFVEEIALLHKTLLYTCVGNHDGYNNATEQGQYENIMSYQDAERYGVTWSNETYPTSFYKDFPDVKIRLISLNQWTKGAGESPYFENMSQAQINMLISALRDCPQDYGVIIMSHNTEGGITKVQDYDKFYQYPNYGISSICMTNANAEQTHPITDIIDAFIAKTTINKQYIANTSPQVTLTVNVDFSNSYGEFIFWACGHNHQDFVGYNSISTQRQLILDITTACAIYGMEVEDNDTCQDGDLPRGGNGATQDCFNIYAIDMENGVVKIARIGSNVNYKMEVRDYMSIPYKV